jgi:ring-1,2-phenylacetyl-CoA epoxidase subunit PaaD
MNTPYTIAAVDSTVSPRVAAVWSLLEQVCDPEIPVLTLHDLGILREVREADDGQLEVVITPTYSGCPAMDQIEEDIRAALSAQQIHARVVTQLAPAWTTDWMSVEGKQKLKTYGIAPPHSVKTEVDVVRFAANPPSADPVACPQCASLNTVESARFGSTACKALYRCLDCKEPFDYFKPY